MYYCTFTDGMAQVLRKAMWNHTTCVALGWWVSVVVGEGNPLTRSIESKSDECNPCLLECQKGTVIFCPSLDQSVSLASKKKRVIQYCLVHPFHSQCRDLMSVTACSERGLMAQGKGIGWLAVNYGYWPGNYVMIDGGDIPDQTAGVLYSRF